jgi:D-lactate dehydrogenase (cytochrome)
MLAKTAPDDLQNYLTDASNMPGGHADKLFIPENTQEIAAILREADEKRIPVTVSGARTGTVGGAIPFGGYIISLEKLDKIKEIDKESRRATVQPGVILRDLQQAVEAEGLFHPPDPTEWSCQVGGTVATNASGARSFKYGATRGFVKGLEVVLPGGHILNLRRGMAVSSDGENIELDAGDRKIRIKVPTYSQPAVRKNTSGYFLGEKLDAIDLFIGSEGTLGIVTEIEFSLLKKPEGTFSGIVFFEDEGNLLKFADEARAISFRSREANDGSSLDASFIEYFDENSLRFIGEKFGDVPAEARGAIFFEQEMTAETEDALLEQWNDLFEKHQADLDRSWFTTTEADLQKMRGFRHALPVAVNERGVRNKQRKVGTDMAVPDEAFPSFLRFYKQKMNESGLEYVIFGHIGDCHLHANMLPKDAAEAEKARHLYGRFIAQAVMLGGTVSAEHGIGKLKRHYLDVMMGERYLNEMAEIKKAFDPNGILGRGNMFEEKFL